MAATVNKIALFNHGVAQITRTAAPQFSYPFELLFKRREMNDILKSLTVEDHGDGWVSGLSYETAARPDESLEEKALPIPAEGSIRELLEKVVGCRVELTLTGESAPVAQARVFGRVIGIQTEDPDEAPPIPAQVVLLLDSDEIQFIDLDLVTRVKLLEPSVQQDLQYFLNALVSQHRKDMKRVTIFLEGNTHDLEIAYLSEMAPWRVTYRLFYTEKETVIQCWGIVDNTLDEDLKTIELTLVSGRPISFIYDLYLAQRLKRQRIREERAISTAPVELEAEQRQLEAQNAQLEAMREAKPQLDRERATAMAKEMEAEKTMTPSAPPPPASLAASLSSQGAAAPKMAKKKMARQRFSRKMELDRSMELEEECEMEPCEGMGMGLDQMGGSAGPGAGMMDDLLTDFESMLDEQGLEPTPVEVEPTAIDDYTAEVGSTEVAAEAIQLAEVFTYDIATPVTIKRGQSAMVPIVQKPLPCTKEAVYNRVKTGKHPLLCMRVENDIGIVFERGPITVIEENTYAGEAILPKLEQNDESRIAYAIATGVTVTEEAKAESTFCEIEIEKDSVIERENHDEQFSYIVANDTLDTLPLVIEHPRSETHTLHEMADPFEVTEEFYKWKLTIEPKREVTFEVTQREIREQRYKILSRSITTYKDLLKAEKLSEEQFAFIERVFDAKKRVDRYQRYLQTLKSQEQTMLRHQQQLDVLLGTLGYAPADLLLRRALVEKCAWHEVRLSKLRQTIVAVHKETRYLTTWLRWLYQPERYPAFEERETEHPPLLKKFLHERTCQSWYSSYSNAVQTGQERKI